MRFTLRSGLRCLTDPLPQAEFEAAYDARSSGTSLVGIAAESLHQTPLAIHTNEALKFWTAAKPRHR